MTVPTVATYSTDALVDVHTAFLDRVDISATAASIKIRDSADVLLCDVPLDDPSGTVDGGTGQLTFTWPGGDVATTAGTAAYGEICDGDGNAHLSMPAQVGVAAVSGYLILNTLTVIAGQPVTIVSATVG